MVELQQEVNNIQPVQRIIMQIRRSMNRPSHRHVLTTWQFSTTMVLYYHIFYLNPCSDTSRSFPPPSSNSFQSHPAPLPTQHEETNQRSNLKQNPPFPQQNKPRNSPGTTHGTGSIPSTSTSSSKSYGTGSMPSTASSKSYGTGSIPATSSTVHRKGKLELHRSHVYLIDSCNRDDPVSG